MDLRRDLRDFRDLRRLVRLLRLLRDLRRLRLRLRDFLPRDFRRFEYFLFRPPACVTGASGSYDSLSSLREKAQGLDVQPRFPNLHRGSFKQPSLPLAFIKVHLLPVRLGRARQPVFLLNLQKDFAAPQVFSSRPGQRARNVKRLWRGRDPDRERRRWPRERE